ncbi:MAG TPA: hypothetical protein VM638_06965 [Actinomycetota bacterium]|nr:hypothetical protein [Actinomycetota bacterium]
MTHHAPNGDRTGYAFVKYAIILVIVIVVLFFLVRYVLPLLTGGDEGNGQEEEPVFPSPPAQTQIVEIPTPDARLLV